MKKALIPITDELLREPGDEISMKVTKTYRKVGKINTKNLKMSRTMYSNGTIVETRTLKGE